MTPTLRSLFAATVWTILGALLMAFPAWKSAWWICGAALGALALIDALLLRFLTPVSIRRRLPGRFALGEPGEIRLTFVNPGNMNAQVEVFDGIPPGAVAEAMPWTGSLPPKREIRVTHPVVLNSRGEAVFGPVWLRRTSPLGLWKRATRHGSDETVRVYPNYEPVIRFALLAMQHRDNPMGIVRRPRAGSSRDFHQLRDYRDGDPLAQIDWKASSRRQMLISRDYQEQRNQSLVFLLDTGRRMRAMDGAMPQFDHVLNAMLLVAHVALRQGDQVAVKSFGGTSRWLPPVKGSHAMPVLLNHLYDYQTTPAPSDFSEAVEGLMARQRRRSMVILLTNLRGEDGKELIPALEVLASRHLVLLASMMERTVLDSVEQPVESHSAALRFLAADRYLGERREILASLTSRGVLTLDSTADQFAISLANRYLDVKAAGRL